MTRKSGRRNEQFISRAVREGDKIFVSPALFHELQLCYVKHVDPKAQAECAAWILSLPDRYLGSGFEFEIVVDDTLKD